ncbi:MAG: GNAT family N-acetyltransferase [Cyanobacteria bacterium P01_B01_bin.77]
MIASGRIFSADAMGQISDINIRPMRHDERAHVRAIMRQSFSLIEGYFFEWTPHVLVAEQGGHLLGAIMLKLFTLPHNRQGGSISWVFITPEARGRRLGQHLVEAGLNFLDHQGCDEILTNVEGCNTSSSKLFATRGFDILSPAAQFKRYGLATFAVWAKLFHYAETGYFIWARPAPQAADSPTLQWWGTIVANSALGYLMLWRLGITRAIDPVMWSMLPIILTLLFGLRYLGMVLMASQQRLTMRFRAWESGFPLSLAITLVFSGAIYPLPGSVYPKTHQWRYRDWQPKLGWVALAGTLPVLLLLWSVWVISQLGILSPTLSAGLNLTLWLGKPLILFDIALPFFPFTCFNGRRLWDWNKIIWALLAIAAVAIWLF